MKNIISFTGLLLISFVEAELEVSWDDKNSPSLVKLAHPSQEQEFNSERIAVILANYDNISLTCKVDFATKKEEIKFTSLRSNGSVLQLGKTNEQHQKVGGLHYLRKEARIEKVQVDMDNSTIKCDYNIPGGEGKAVKATLSVWKMTMAARDINCKMDDRIDILFSENGKRGADETNIISQMEAKVRDILNMTLPYNAIKNEFKTTLKCNVAKVNEVLRNITDTVKVGNETIRAVEYFKVPCAMSPWTSYTPCTVTCGGGSKIRTREISDKNDGDCGAIEESLTCGDTLCPGSCKCNGKYGWYYLVPGGECKTRSTSGCEAWCYVDKGNSGCEDALRSSYGEPWDWSCQACKEDGAPTSTNLLDSFKAKVSNGFTRIWKWKI